MIHNGGIYIVKTPFEVQNNNNNNNNNTNNGNKNKRKHSDRLVDRPPAGLSTGSTSHRVDSENLHSLHFLLRFFWLSKHLQKILKFYFSKMAVWCKLMNVLQYMIIQYNII